MNNLCALFHCYSFIKECFGISENLSWLFGHMIYLWWSESDLTGVWQTYRFGFGSGSGIRSETFNYSMHDSIDYRNRCRGWCTVSAWSLINRISFCVCVWIKTWLETFSDLLHRSVLSERRMFCLIRRGQARGVTTSVASLDSTGALDSEGCLGLLLRAPFRNSSRGEPGMVFFALPRVHFLTSGAFSEKQISGVKSEGRICGVLVLHSTSFSLTAERNNREKYIKHQKNIEKSGIHIIRTNPKVLVCKHNTEQHNTEL